MSAAEDAGAHGLPAAVAEPAVRCSGLTKRYGELTAVDALDLEVPVGSIYGLIGPNGAGKTTTFAMVASLLRPSDGALHVFGTDPGRDPKAVRRRLGFMPDVLGLYESLTVEEYLDFFASAYGIGRAERHRLVAELLDLLDLGVMRRAMVDSLSRGQKQRVSLARALIHDPDLLVLDEPASGLDPRARFELRGLLGDLQQMGKTILISSHILPELQQVCTEIAILDRGRLLAAGTPQAILDQLGRTRQVRVRLVDGSEALHHVADEAAQAALLRRLVVDEGHDIVEFAVERAGLEELYLDITSEAPDDAEPPGPVVGR